MNAEMDISKNQWRSTGGLSSSGKKVSMFENFLAKKNVSTD
jgi:hypothetical protein